MNASGARLATSKTGEESSKKPRITCLHIPSEAPWLELILREGSDTHQDPYPHFFY